MSLSVVDNETICQDFVDKLVAWVYNAIIVTACGQDFVREFKHSTPELCITRLINACDL